MKTIKAFAALALTMAMSFSAIAGEPEFGGYCPVCYSAAGKAVQGSKEFAAEHGGKTYYFVSADVMKKFQESPEKFLPAYDGKCAVGMAMGKEIAADPTQFTTVDGKVYLNSNKEMNDKFAAESKDLIMKADANHAKMMKK